jgi:hypothetical protein
MTGLEVLSIVHGEQGFLVLNSSHAYEEGQVIGGNGSLYRKEAGRTVHEDIPQPIRILGTATREDFIRQSRRVSELTESDERNWYVRYPYFYKVVAPD